MTATYTWKTPRGSEVSMTVTVHHITQETISSDGWPVDVKCDRWDRTVDHLTVNGKETDCKQLGMISGKQVVIIGYSGHTPICASLPSDVYDAIYGEESRAREAKLERELEFARKIEAHREMMRKVMGY